MPQIRGPTMKNFSLSKIKTSTLMIVGVLALVISFIYCFVLKNPYDVVLWMICIIDFLLFTLIAYRMNDNSNRSKPKRSFSRFWQWLSFSSFGRLRLPPLRARTALNCFSVPFWSACFYLPPSFCCSRSWSLSPKRSDVTRSFPYNTQHKKPPQEAVFIVYQFVFWF